MPWRALARLARICIVAEVLKRYLLVQEQMAEWQSSYATITDLTLRIGSTTTCRANLQDSSVQFLEAPNDSQEHLSNCRLQRRLPASHSATPP